jgi:hypothetical protein
MYIYMLMDEKKVLWNDELSMDCKIAFFPPCFIYMDSSMIDFVFFRDRNIIQPDLVKH